MQLTEASIGGAIDILRDNDKSLAGYRQLLGILRSASVPRRGTAKAKPRFVYDQTALVKALREDLVGDGWLREIGLWPDINVDGVRLAGVRSDMLRDGVHVIFEFGNRSSWAYNLVTRVVLGVARADVGLTVVVTPTHPFAESIDSNLATFERVSAELARIHQVFPPMVPGRIMVIGVEPENDQGIGP